MSDSNLYTRYNSPDTCRWRTGPTRVGGLLFGLREQQSFSVDPPQLPDDLSGFSLREDGGWSSLIEEAPALRRFLPALEHLEIAHHISGLCAYNPDGLPLLGELPGFDGDNRL